jgi:diguanylate cyclase
MLKHQIIELELRKRLAAPGRFEWLKGVADETLALLRDLLASDDEKERAELGRRVDALRSKLEGDDEARALAEQVLLHCREAVNRAMQQRVDQRRELATLVTLVHDAMKSVGEEVSAFETTVGDSTARFEQIGMLNDPRQIKARLIDEIKTLREVAAERRQAWETNEKIFAERIEILERQLMFTKKEAAVDPLTGIANRRTFDQLLADWMRRPGMQFVLAFIDVDDFKSINDTHGHAVGDQVLMAIANRLAESFRSDDVVARIGGDEFAIMVSHLTLRQAEGRFGKLVSGLFPAPGDGSLPCLPKVTCGLAEFSAGDTTASLCVRADQAMYAAKRLGKNRVVAKEQAFVRDLLRRQV